MLCTEDGYLFLSSWRQISIPFITLSVSSCSPAAPANPFVRKEVILRHWIMQQLRRGQIVSLWEIRNGQIFVGSRLCTVCCCKGFALVHPAERALISDTLWSYQSNILSKIFKNLQNLNDVISNCQAYCISRSTIRTSKLNIILDELPVWCTQSWVPFLCDLNTLVHEATGYRRISIK